MWRTHQGQKEESLSAWWLTTKLLGLRRKQHMGSFLRISYCWPSELPLAKLYLPAQALSYCNVAAELVQYSLLLSDRL